LSAWTVSLPEWKDRMTPSVFMILSTVVSLRPD
jgi:hypothetical protein